jgi:quercetin dioxygenase-like cupin family protein
MSSFAKRMAVAAVIFCAGLVLRHLASGQGATSHLHNSETNERARIVLSKPLSKLDGDHLKVALVEVNYGPGEESSPHSHPCAVIGYVVQGTLRTQVKGEPEMTYKAGESFYEAPNGVHLVSANASSTEPAKLVAYLICDHDTPLSLDVSKTIYQKETAK